MSKLKLRLRKILTDLGEQAKKNKDREVRRRFSFLVDIVKSPKSVKLCCQSKGISTDCFYDWVRKLVKNPGDINSLKSTSTKPRRCPHQTPRRVEKRIKNLRLAEPAEGPERISFNLKQLYNIECSPSTVYSVLNRLKLITKEYRKKLTKAHLKRYRQPLPGWLQMDVKYVPYLINGKRYYQFNAVDHCSTWRCLRAYEDKGYGSLCLFLKELEENCPFPILEIQTDNGTEFTDKYRPNSDGHPTGDHPLDVWCKKRDIRHKLIPIGQKELNGKVENTHRQDDREFYAKYRFEHYWQLENFMRSYNQRWNSQRATKSLHWKTPNQVILASCVSWVAGMIHWQSKFNGAPSTLTKIDSHGNIFLPVPKSKKIIQPKPKKSKKINFVDRYLSWMEGESKKIKSLLPLSLIWPNFSRRTKYMELR